MRECLVGFSHFMGVFAFLDRGALVTRGVHQLTSEASGHIAASTLGSTINHPTHSQRQSARAGNLNRDLVRCTTNAAGLYFDQRGDELRCVGIRKCPRGSAFYH